MGAQENKAAAIRFLQLAASGRVAEAYERVGPDFKHHNPWFKAGAAALSAGMEANAKNNPHKSFEVLRALAEADLVTVHSRVRQKPGDPFASVMHLFRFAGELIVELWDVGAGEQGDSPNADGLF